MIAHWLFVVIVAVVTAGLAVLFAKINKKIAVIIIKTIFAIVFINEIAAMIRKIAEGADFLHVWPFYLCSFLALAAPLIVIFNVKFLKDFAFVICLFAGLGYVLFPGYGFDGAPLRLTTVLGMLMHVLAFITPVLAIACGFFLPKLKNYWKIFPPMAVCVINCEIGYALIGQDSLFLRPPEGGLSFAFWIIPHPVALAVLAVSMVTLFYLAFHFAPKFLKKRAGQNKVQR